MNKTTSINNRRYLGNKYKLLPFITSVVDANCAYIGSVADVFAGTGAVASALCPKKAIAAQMPNYPIKTFIEYFIAKVK